MIIKPLCTETLQGAQALVQNTFKPSRDELLTLQVSLAPEQFDRWRRRMAIESLKYWVAYCSASNHVAGIVGLYENFGNSDTVWLGWYCVDPAFRGRQIGARLLDFAIASAHADQKKALMLYTGRDKSYEKARDIYEKRGFVIVPTKSKNMPHYRLNLGLSDTV